MKAAWINQKPQKEGSLHKIAVVLFLCAKSAIIARFFIINARQSSIQRLCLYYDMSAKRKEAWNYEGHGENSHQHVRLWIAPKSISSLNFMLFILSKWISYSEWQVLLWNKKRERKLFCRESWLPFISIIYVYLVTVSTIPYIINHFSSHFY